MSLITIPLLVFIYFVFVQSRGLHQRSHQQQDASTGYAHTNWKLTRERRNTEHK